MISQGKNIGHDSVENPSSNLHYSKCRSYFLLLHLKTFWNGTDINDGVFPLQSQLFLSIVKWSLYTRTMKSSVMTENLLMWGSNFLVMYF